MFAPSAMAASKSPLIPMDKKSIEVLSYFFAPMSIKSSRIAAKYGLESSGEAATGGIAISPRTLTCPRGAANSTVFITSSGARPLLASSRPMFTSSRTSPSYAEFPGSLIYEREQLFAVHGLYEVGHADEILYLVLLQVPYEVQRSAGVGPGGVFLHKLLYAVLPAGVNSGGHRFAHTGGVIHLTRGYEQNPAALSGVL